MKSAIELAVSALLLLLIAALFGLSACDGKSSTEKPPIRIPIELQKVGVLAELRFEITDHLIYEYFLRFGYKSDDQAERARVRKLLGGHEIDRHGAPLEPGISTPIKLTILKIETASSNEWYQKKIDPVLTSWGSGTFDKNIGHCDLPPGNYIARLEGMRSSPELSHVPAEFVIGMNKFKFSFDPNKYDRTKTCPQ